MSGATEVTAGASRDDLLAAIWETLTVLDSIDHVADEVIGFTSESAVMGELIKACTLRIRAAVDPHFEEAEAARAAACRAD